MASEMTLNNVNNGLQFEINVDHNKEEKEKEKKRNSHYRKSTQSDIIWDYSKVQKDDNQSIKVNFYKKLPLSIKTLIYMIIGSSIIMIIPLIDALLTFYIDVPNIISNQFNNDAAKAEEEGHWVQTFNPNLFRSYRMNIYYIPVWCLGIWAAISWSVFFLCRWVIFTIIRIIEPVLTAFGLKKAHHYVYYLTKIRYFIIVDLWVCFTWVAWMNLIDNPSFLSWQFFPPSPTVNYIWFTRRTLLSLFIAILLFGIAKFFIQIFAINFHQKTYYERIKHQEFSMMAVEKLTKSLPGQADIIPKKIVKNFAHVVYSIASQYETRKKFAKNLYHSLKLNHPDHLIIQDFRPYFDNEDDTIKAFQLFDNDDNKYIDKQEFYSELININEEKVNLEESLRNSGAAMRKLDNLITFLVFIVCIFTTLSLFEVDLSSFLTTLGAIWLGMIFAVGGTVKNLVESIIFIFLQHPFDIGDRIEIEKEIYFVRKFGLMQTVLEKIDCSLIYAPNIQLAQKFIKNVRRSNAQSETFKYIIKITTSIEQINKLRKSLEIFIKGREKEFRGVMVVIDSFASDNLKLAVTIEYKFNWQDGIRYGGLRNEFLVHVKKQMELLEIEFPSRNRSIPIDEI